MMNIKRCISTKEFENPPCRLRCSRTDKHHGKHWFKEYWDQMTESTDSYSAQDYMSFVTIESPYCIKDGIPMVLFERGIVKGYLCGHCGVFVK